jgi:hypothetical protein
MGKLFKWYIEILWSIYGREKIVEYDLYRERTFFGRIQNRIALRILFYIFGKGNEF